MPPRSIDIRFKNRFFNRERQTIRSFVTGRTGMIYEIAHSEDGAEFAAVGVSLPGCGIEDCRWFSINRVEPGFVLIGPNGQRLAASVSLWDLLDSFRLLLPGYQRSQYAQKRAARKGLA